MPSQRSGKSNFVKTVRDLLRPRAGSIAHHRPGGFRTVAAGRVAMGLRLCAAEANGFAASTIRGENSDGERVPAPAARCRPGRRRRC